MIMWKKRDRVRLQDQKSVLGQDQGFAKRSPEQEGPETKAIMQQGAFHAALISPNAQRSPK